jgi:hypothetical protein
VLICNLVAGQESTDQHYCICFVLGSLANPRDGMERPYLILPIAYPVFHAFISMRKGLDFCFSAVTQGRTIKLLESVPLVIV